MIQRFREAPPLPREARATYTSALEQQQENKQQQQQQQQEQQQLQQQQGLMSADELLSLDMQETDVQTSVASPAKQVACSAGSNW